MFDNLNNPFVMANQDGMIDIDNNSGTIDIDFAQAQSVSQNAFSNSGMTTTCKRKSNK